jgi:hypothetical protein
MGDYMLTLEKEFMTLEESAQFIGMKRASLYNYIKDLGIQTHKFKRDRRVYLSMADVKRIQLYKEQPWIEGKERGE